MKIPSARTNVPKLLGAGFALVLGGGTLAAVSPAAAAGVTTLRVDTVADTVDADPSDGRCADAAGDCSLRAAVQTANAGTGWYHVLLRSNTYELMIAGDDADGAEAGDLDLTGQMRLKGFDATIDLSGLGDRAFDIAADADVTIERLTVTNADLTSGASGGAFRNAGALDLNLVTATDNAVSGEGASGGAILNTGTLQLNRVTLSNNSASRAGGAIEANGGETIVIQSTLDGNTTGAMPGNGGALHLTGDGHVRVHRSTVTGNTAAAEGGGLWNSAVGEMVVTRSDLSGNVANGLEADQGGGALFNDGGMMRVSDTTLTGNAAPLGSGSGGGVLNNAGVLEMSNVEVSENSAQRAGGGVETINGAVTILQSSFSSNVTGPAPGNGGALHVSGTQGHVEIKRSSFTDNVAALEGGGLWAGAGDSQMIVRSSVIAGNVANGVEAINGGGGIFNKGGVLVVEDSTIAGNVATSGSGSGGGILNLGSLSVVRTTIDANAAARAGGGIESNDVNGAGDAVLSRVALIDNVTGPAPGNGGGMHVTGSSIMTAIDDSLVTGNSATNEGGGLWNFADATMTVTNTTVIDNTAPIGADVFQNGASGNFTIDGELVTP